jgi:hypothetical protein
VKGPQYTSPTSASPISAEAVTKPTSSNINVPVVNDVDTFENTMLVGQMSSRGTPAETCTSLELAIVKEWPFALHDTEAVLGERRVTLTTGGLGLGLARLGLPPLVESCDADAEAVMTWRLRLPAASAPGTSTAAATSMVVRKA